MATVLIVDDRPINREIARDALGRGGHRVIEAADGFEALALARANRPDAIVVDVLMPGMDGYEFVHELRTATDTARIPVLFYTANYRPDELEPIASTLEVSKILLKSAEPAELLRAVDEAIHDRPTPLPREAHAAFDARHARTVKAKLVETVQALDESDARFLTMAETAPVGIVACDVRCHATYVNQRLSDIIGVAIAGLLGQGWLHGLSPGCRRKIEEYAGLSAGAAHTDTLRYQDRITLSDGRLRWLTVLLRVVRDSDGAVSGFVATIDDNTPVVEAEQRRRAEESEREAEQRRQISQRFDSLSRLAGAVAHDFNNLLNTVVNCGDFARDAITGATGAVLTAGAAAEILDDLRRIRDAGLRAGGLAHQLLTLGGKEAVTPTVADLNAVVARAGNRIDAAVGPRATVTTRLHATASQVLIDEEQLAQVLVNLATNARDAMAGEGNLHIETANTGHIGAGPTPTLATGEYVHVTVTDTGTGMPPEVAQRAIEPFFSTKQPGQGTGLGLATSYGIVKQAGGDLAIESAPGHGTTVHLYLPITALRPGPPPPAGTATAPEGKMVLVAEDDDDVRAIVGRILTGAGYRVLVGADGEAALAAAARHPGAIDVLLTDVVMPKMNGKQLAEKFLHERPGTPVLYMSGHAAAIMTAQGLPEPGVTVIGKPFTRPELLDAVGAALAGQPAPAASPAP